MEMYAHEVRSSAPDEDRAEFPGEKGERIWPPLVALLPAARETGHSFA